MRFSTMHPARHDRGQVLIITAFAMIVLVAIAAIVVDLGFSWMLHRQEQDARDDDDRDDAQQRQQRHQQQRHRHDSHHRDDADHQGAEEGRHDQLQPVQEPAVQEEPGLADGVEGMPILEHGDAAVVTCKGTYETPKGSVTLKFMRVWLKRDGRWQIIAGSIAN